MHYFFVLFEFGGVHVHSSLASRIITTVSEIVYSSTMYVHKIRSYAKYML